jgi:hypothetical protein
MEIYKPPTIRHRPYGAAIITTTPAEDFKYLLGMNVNDIVLFDDSTDGMLEEGRTILPRHYFIFVGDKDGEIQFKPYEPNKFRIVVATYKNIISEILSIG